MPSRAGEFSAAGRSDHESRLETGGCEAGGVCREIRPARRREGRLVEEEKSHPKRDWPDVEGALGYQAAAQLPGVSPMKMTNGNYRGTGILPVGLTGVSPVGSCKRAGETPARPTGRMPVPRAIPVPRQAAVLI